jgi:hypothetical protein
MAHHDSFSIIDMKDSRRTSVDDAQVDGTYSADSATSPPSTDSPPRITGRHIPSHGENASTPALIEHVNRAFPPAHASPSGTGKQGDEPDRRRQSFAQSPLQRVLSIESGSVQRPASSQAAYGADGLSQRPRRRNRVLDHKAKLRKEEDSVVRRRDGGVLARG